MKDKIIVGQTLIERCIAWGFPGVAICGISLLIAISIGNDFGGNSVVEVVAFAASNIFFWLLYATIFQFLPQDVLASLLRKKHQVEPCLSVIAPEESVECRHEASDTTEPEEAKTAITQDDGDKAGTIEPDIHAIYEQRNRQHQLEMLQRRERVLTSVREYVLETMSPFVDIETIRIIQEDIMAWANDNEHSPMPVHVRNGWSTLDSRHFIWNIAARLRLLGGDYSIVRQGFFIKRMFPDVCKDAEAEYLGKNLTIKPNEGLVHIDRPVKDDWRFRFEKGKDKE